MAANQNKLLSGGLAQGLTKRVTVARTSVATIASPADATDMRLLFTAGTEGGFIDEIGYQVVGTGTQAASLVYIWRATAANANAEIIYTFTVAAGSAMSNTVPGARATWNPAFENLPSGETIYATVSVLSANCEFVVWSRGGSFTSQ